MSWVLSTRCAGTNTPSNGEDPGARPAAAAELAGRLHHQADRHLVAAVAGGLEQPVEPGLLKRPMGLDRNEAVALRLQRLLSQHRHHRPRAVEDVFAGRARVRWHPSRPVYIEAMTAPVNTKIMRIASTEERSIDSKIVDTPDKADVLFGPAAPARVYTTREIAKWGFDFLASPSRAQDRQLFYAYNLMKLDSNILKSVLRDELHS